jgi:hypothetical protein
VEAGGVAMQRMTEDELSETVKTHSLVLVLYYPDPCNIAECQNVNKELPTAAESIFLKDMKLALVGNAAFTFRLGINTEPRMVLYRNSVPILFDAASLRADELIAWIQDNLQSYVRPLDVASFEHETQAATGATTGDWFVRFYRPDCDDLTAVWEAVASSLHGRINVANVDISSSQDLATRFQINKCPSIVFFRNGKMFMYELPVNTVQSYVSFAEGWYINAPSKPVPREQTPFDAIVEKAVIWLKANLEGNNSILSLTSTSIVISSCFLVLTVAAVLVWLRIRLLRSRTLKHE